MTQVLSHQLPRKKNNPFNIKKNFTKSFQRIVDLQNFYLKVTGCLSVCKVTERTAEPVSFSSTVSFLMGPINVYNYLGGG